LIALYLKFKYLKKSYTKW